MKINWKVRAKNIHFWGQIVVTIVIAMLTYAGVSGSEITTWGKLFDLIKATLSNPYILVMIGVSVYNAVIDPTTHGFGDSEQALTYDKPKESEG